MPERLSNHRCAVVAPYLWPEQLGCAPYATDVVTGLTRRGFAPEVLAAVPHYPSKRAVSRQPKAASPLADVSIDRAWVADRSSGGAGVRLFNDALFALQCGVWAARREPSPRTALVFAPTVAALPALRAAGYRGRVVAVVYDIESALATATGVVGGVALPQTLRWVERTCLATADAVITITDQMRTALLELGVRAPVEVLPLWPLSAPLGEVSAPVDDVVMYSGVLARRHGAALFPAFWRSLRRRAPGVRLVLQGAGPELEWLRDELGRLGGAVELRPPASAARHAASLREAGLQLVLQAPECAGYTFPSKAIACLAAGVPFVCNAQRGTALASFAVRSGGGVAVEPGDPEGLAGQVAALLADRAARGRMAAAGRAYLAEEHDRERLMDRYVQVLAG